MIDKVDESIVGAKVSYVGNKYTEFGYKCCPKSDIIGIVTDVCGGNIEVEWPYKSTLISGPFWYYPYELNIVGVRP